MDSSVARHIARLSHRGHRNRFGEPMIEHLARVAASVPPEARATAWLHDLFERSDRSAAELSMQGLTEDELAALALLTHRPSESYAAYAERIAAAGGEAGRLARLVKLADLDDHLAHPRIPDDAPPYGWAHRRIAAAQTHQGPSL